MKSTAFKVLKEAALFKLRPKFSHLILHVTNICNFRCQHCFVDFEKAPKDLTLEEIGKVAAVLDDLLWLDIGGGEPFLRPDLDRIVTSFKTEEVSIPTNGWYTDKILESLRKIGARMDLNRLIITISIDGLEATHDEIRKHPGSFKRLAQTFEALRREFPSLRLKINTVVNQRNFSEAIALMKWVQDTLKPAFHSLLLLRGSPINPDYRLPTLEEIKSFQDEVDKIQQAYLYGRTGILSDIQRHYQFIKREVANAIIEQKTQVIPCLGGQAHVVVYANGSVAPCELLPPVGNIRQAGLSDILGGPQWAQAVAAIRAKQCHCTHDCNMVENVLFNFNLYPQLLFGTAKQRR